ncbi:hypothetical protein BGZ47_003476 [Haplosporangium gracile]|nr:hypothetical protein BGZ47_003476 [Haplosporangium gracile]
MTSQKIGVLVAIPIKGRKLVNRTGGKQSPYVQLKLGEQKKRTRASLIASIEPEWDQEASPFNPLYSFPLSLLSHVFVAKDCVRLDVFQDQLDMKVSIFDEGKKGELVGDGVLLLNEVIDKGELDVWFPIKFNGTAAGDIYFELTFYAVAPPPAAGSTPPLATPQTQIHTPLRYNQPGFQGGAPGIHPLPHTPPVSGFGSPAIGHLGGPPAPFAGNMYHPPGPGGYVPGAGVRPFSPAHQTAFTAQQPVAPLPPFGGSPAPVSGPGFSPAFGNANNNSPFHPPGAFSNPASPPFGQPGLSGSGPGPVGGAFSMPQPPFNSGPNNNFSPNNCNNGSNNFAPNNNSFPPNNTSFSPNNNNNGRFPMPQGPSPNMNNGPSFPQGPGGPNNSFGNNNNNNNNGPNNFGNSNNNGPNNNFNSNNRPNNFSSNSNNSNLSSGTSSGNGPVTPLMQYNYSLGGSFP